jgi:hypothetical protein
MNPTRAKAYNEFSCHFALSLEWQGDKNEAGKNNNLFLDRAVLTSQLLLLKPHMPVIVLNSRRPDGLPNLDEGEEIKLRVPQVSLHFDSNPSLGSGTLFITTK